MRRQRSDSVTAAVDNARQAASPLLQWPATVPPMPARAEQAKAEAIFAELAEARALADWRRSDILQLAHLAIGFVQMGRLQTLIEEQGFTVRGNGKDGPGTGGQIVNPLLAALQQVGTRVDSMCRRLGLGVSALGDPRTTESRAKAASAARGRRPLQVAAPAASGDAVDWVAALALEQPQ